MPLHIGAQCQIERLVDHPLVSSVLQQNTDQIDDEIERTQRPVLPFVDQLDHALGHLRYQPRRDVGVIHLFERVNDITGAQTLGVEGKELVVHLSSGTGPCDCCRSRDLVGRVSGSPGARPFRH